MAAAERKYDFIDNRKYPRISCHIPCRFTMPLGNSRRARLKGLIRNISAGGALLETQRKKSAELNVNDIVRLEFTLELNDEMMFVEARAIIVHNARNKFGLMFSDISDEVIERVLDYAGE